MFLGLSKREWTVYGKLLAAAFFALCYVVANIALEYPADMFIYGRF